MPDRLVAVAKLWSAPAEAGLGIAQRRTHHDDTLPICVIVMNGVLLFGTRKPPLHWIRVASSVLIVLMLAPFAFAIGHAGLTGN